MLRQQACRWFTPKIIAAAIVVAAFAAPFDVAAEGGNVKRPAPSREHSRRAV